MSKRYFKFFSFYILRSFNRNICFFSISFRICSKRNGYLTVIASACRRYRKCSIVRRCSPSHIRKYADFCRCSICLYFHTAFLYGKEFLCTCFYLHRNNSKATEKHSCIITCNLNETVFYNLSV